jgi:hypothetical protein
MQPPPTAFPTAGWRRFLATAVVVPALALTAAGCSSGSSGSSSQEPAGSGTTESSDATGTPPGERQTNAKLAKVEGKLPQDKRAAVRKQVGAAVDAWFDAAYVGGTYPRSDFSASWPGFTPGAQADAQRDKRLMSNESIGSQISGVTATARRVEIDVLAVQGHPRGATARFVLRFTTSGDVQRTIEISGRLYLTPGSNGGWKIFGYDVNKGRGA